jgi:hypothetical protein
MGNYQKISMQLIKYLNEGIYLLLVFSIDVFIYIHKNVEFTNYLIFL